MNKKEFKTKTSAMQFASRRINDGFSIVITPFKGYWKHQRKYVVEWYAVNER